jgi:DNA-binding transcriptional LysR family regulator
VAAPSHHACQHPTGSHVSFDVSHELIETCAKSGHGIGVSLLVPGRPLPTRVRAVSLPGFPELKLGVVCRGPRDPVIDAILQATKKRVRDL